jgi:hypothetical protein
VAEECNAYIVDDDVGPDASDVELTETRYSGVCIRHGRILQDTGQEHKVRTVHLCQTIKCKDSPDTGVVAVDVSEDDGSTFPSKVLEILSE